MFRRSLSLAATLLPFVYSQTTYNVQVGPGGALVYEPEWINAVAGDIVTFSFNPKNHTVTQSSFDTPCTAADGGFRSGFVPVAAGADPVERTFTVPEGTAPLWFYCGQTGHCGQGMVFAINPPADGSPNSFAAFKQRALGQNTATTSSAPPSTLTTPAPPAWQTATATVTYGGSVYTTTYTSYAGTGPPTPAAVPVDHKISVGANGQLTYSPANITAAIGDTVTFEFNPKNHTVTQSSFLTPCSPLQNGFRSGFRPVSASDTVLPTFQIRINDTAPIWGYCGQVNHCQQGMVFSINAVETGPNNFAAFRALAQGSTPGTTTGTGTGSPSPSSSTNGAVANTISYSLFALLAFSAINL